MSYFDFYTEELTADQRQELNGLMAIHEKAGARPYDAAMQAVRDKLAQAHENKAEVKRVIFESANPLKKYVDSAAHKAASSPKNNLPIPTAAQREAGNHTMGHLTLHGLSITIEIPKGGERSGIAPDGTPWSVEMLSHYGYLKRAIGADGENFDCYIGDDPSSQRVWIVDQVNAETGIFDEHKALLGYEDQEDATRAYLGAFSDGKGKARIGAITEISLESFKEWLKTDKTQKPMSAVLEGAGADPKTIKSWINKIAKAKTPDIKTDLFYKFLDSGGDENKLIQAMVLSLPAGGYKLHSYEYGTNITDVMHRIYGTFPGRLVTEPLLLGLTAIKPKSIQASFTHNMDKIEIYPKSNSHINESVFFDDNNYPLKDNNILESAYDYKSEIEKATTYEDIEAVFVRVFTNTSSTQIMLTIPNTEDGVEAIVAKIQGGYSVVLRDVDADMIAQTAKIFQTEEDAINYAKQIAGV